MNEFDDASMEFSETETIEVPETSDWVDFDSAETNDISIDTAENVDVEDIPDLPLEAAFDDSDIQSEAEKAADYARSYGFDKAADYIERHYDGDEFIPGDPIPITTRNMAMDGLESENGVLFERRTAELADGLSVEGVFPEFESKHHVELGNVANDMSIYQQFNACKEDFQDHMYDSPEKLQDISFGAMERMESPHGYIYMAAQSRNRQFRLGITG